MVPATFSLKSLPFGETGILKESFTLSLKKEDSECMVITSLSRYEGESAPTIQFFLHCALDEKREKPFYNSHIYKIGQKGQWTRQEWRVPPMFHPSLHCEIRVEIPEGTVLELADFHNRYETPARDNGVGFRHNAHLGFYGVAPPNTVPAFELAAQCGFSTCITNPKELGDGSLVCIHDSTVTRHARTETGGMVDDERSIYTMTLPEIRRWDYGIKKSRLFRGTQIPELEDFFRICARTGMKPMFSAHGNCMKESGWRKVKELLARYGLSRQLHVKSGSIAMLELAYEVLGDTIDGYTLDNLEPEVLAESKLAGAKCRLVVEWQAHHYTQEAVRHILDMGFTAAAYYLPVGPMSVYEQLMSWGVTEFTEDFHISMGLNW